MANKLDKDHLTPGAIVMVGPSTCNGRTDRSWCDSIWRVDAVTGDAVLVRRMSRLDSYGNVLFLRYSERSWWQAEHVLDAYKAAVEETTKEFADQRAEAQKLDDQIRHRASSVIVPHAS